MPFRRQQHFYVPLLVGLVLGLDLLWAALEIPNGSLAFGLVDEPAHLATCAIALLMVAALRRRPLPAAFVVTALIGSVAIDLDHLPGYLGWDAWIGSAPRPYSHSLATVLVVLGLGFLLPRRYRGAMLGLAFGVSIHILRDLATGPGVPFALPLSGAPAGIPYLFYAFVLVVMVATVALGFGRVRRPRPALARQAGAAASLLLAVALTAAGPVELAEAKPTPRKSRVAIGIYLPGSERDPSLIDSYAQAVGRQPAILSSYKTWSELPFDHEALGAVWARGSMPLITWEPWGEFEGEGISLWDIAAGNKDSYIAEAARQAASWGGRLFVRFAHEMNGNWYPWGNNDPAVYKEAWRRIVIIFRQEGADNVEFVWCPYVDFGRTPFKRYYPGDHWVDWASLDGFNWGEPFMSFQRIFDESYNKMVRLTSKPIMIAETGSVEGTWGAKAVWIRRAFKRALPRYPHIRALVWFSDVHPRGMDWRVDSSFSALSALAGVMQKRRYAPQRPFLLATPPWLKISEAKRKQ